MPLPCLDIRYTCPVAYYMLDMYRVWVEVWQVLNGKTAEKVGPSVMQWLDMQPADYEIIACMDAWFSEWESHEIKKARQASNQ